MSRNTGINTHTETQPVQRIGEVGQQECNFGCFLGQEGCEHDDCSLALRPAPTEKQKRKAVGQEVCEIFKGVWKTSCNLCLFCAPVQLGVKRLLHCHTQRRMYKERKGGGGGLVFPYSSRNICEKNVLRQEVIVEVPKPFVNLVFIFKQESAVIEEVRPDTHCSDSQQGTHFQTRTHNANWPCCYHPAKHCRSKNN